MKHAILGTGLIGTGFGLAALDRGDVVVAYNRTASRTATLRDAGASIAETAAEAVNGAPFVHLALTADAAVDAVLADIVPHLEPDTIVIDHSTTLPATTRERAQRLAEQGVSFLHAPVFMSPLAFRQAQGIIVVCGPESAYNVASDVLFRMTSRVWYVGEDPSAAATLKLCGNAMILAMIGALADGHSIAANNGLPAESVTELFRLFDVSKSLSGRGERMAEADYSTQWSLTMARKDLSLMTEAAGDKPLSVLPGLGRRLDHLIAEGEGDKDLAIVGRDAHNPVK